MPLFIKRLIITMKNNNIHNNSKNFTYWFLLIRIIFLLYYIAEYDYNVICCDSADNSIDQFFIDENQPSRTVYSSDRSFLESHYSDVYCSSFLDKYKNIGKRKAYWFLFEKGKGKYTNYIEYKKSWNPNMNIISELKKQLKSDLENSSHNIKKAKRSLSWFLRGSKPGGGRGL